MVVKKENSAIVTTTKYNFNRKAGRSIIDRKPIFSPDGESVIVIVENIIRVYNIQTADCSRILETENVIKELVSIQFPENDKYNLYGCSDCGLVTIWTWDSGAVLRELKLKIPQNCTILSFDLIDSNECFISAKNPGTRFLYVASHSIKTGEVIYEYKSTNVPYNGILSVSLGYCDGDKYAAIVNGTKCLFIQNLIQPHLRANIMNHNKLRIISVAAHPTHSCVAITDTLGRVTVIRGYLYNYRNLSKEVLHWHFLPPFAACFPREGSYLLTGGMEKVLIKWTVGNLANKHNEKAVLPRLPGMVRHIATSDTHVVLALTNNSLLVTTGQLRVVSTVAESGGLAAAAARVLACRRRRPALLLAGRTGHLQLYSTATNTLICNIDITEMNNIPPSRTNLLPLEMEVTCAAVSADGGWLVTSEYRYDGVTYPEERLKFWASLEGPTPYKLNTCVNLSHGGCLIVSLALNNNGDICVSAGGDQKFRIWKRETDHKSNVSWNCHSACYYASGVAQSLAHGILNDFKNSEFNGPEDEEATAYQTEERHGSDVITKIMNINKDKSLLKDVSHKGMRKNDEFDMGGVAISQDGSLIAAWFGCKLTLWDTHASCMRTSLAHPALKPKGLEVQFGNEDAAHILICSTEKCVAVWSLLSLTIKWLVNIKPSCLVADPFSNKFAVVTTNNDVYVLSGLSPTPVLRRQRLLSPGAGVFRKCVFGPASGEDVRLYMTRNNSEIYCLEPEQSEEDRLEVISHSNVPPSKFSAMLAEQQLSDVGANGPASLDYLDTNGLGKTAISEFLSAAPHMMPPVSLLCTSFLEHISGRQVTSHDDEVTDVMEVDPTSSDDEEPIDKEYGAFVPKKTELWTVNFEAVKEKRLKEIFRDNSLNPDVVLSWLKD